MSTTAIETIGLRKRFGSLQVLADLELKVCEGEVYGLLGRNGAGKSTLIHLLLGFLHADGGQIKVLGVSPEQAQSRLGYLPEHARYHIHFTAREYLRALGTLSNLRGSVLESRCRTVLEMVGLASAADRRLGGYSKGMLQRLGIAQALIHDPDLLLIDEPTLGLDPAGQREMIDLLAELRRRGHTVLMCTHQLAEVEELCDRVGIINQGRLAAEARVGDLRFSAGVTITPRQSLLPEAVTSRLRTWAPAVTIADKQVLVGGDEELQRHVLRVLIDAEVGIGELRPSGSGVERLYLSVMGEDDWRGARAAPASAEV